MADMTISGFPVEVVRKKIKNLHLAVYPPTGHVRVAVPLHVGDEAVRLAVISRLGWIRRQQRKFKAQVRMSPRTYETGESHYFMGRRYRLNVIEGTGPQQAILRSKTRIELRVHPGSSVVDRERVMNSWYRRKLKALIPPLLEKWQPILGVQTLDWRIRLMKTKWGTCNSSVGRIWINLELARLPVSCLEYVIVHELVHLIERNHGSRFQAVMNEAIPNWQRLRAVLSDFPLAQVR